MHRKTSLPGLARTGRLVGVYLALALLLFWGLVLNVNMGSVPIPAGEIHALYKGLKKGDQDTLRQILRSVPDRVHTILPGLAILTAILDAYEVSTVSVSACGVREGYLLRRVMEGTSHDA